MNKKVWTIVGILIVFIVGGTLFLKSKEKKEDVATSVDMKITHKLGEATLKKNPKKVVVFDYGTLDSLDKMGIEIKGLPKSNIPSYLSKYKDDKYIDVGTLFEPNFEKLNEIKPDVIFISARQSKAYQELNKIAPTIHFNTENGKYMESVKSNLEKLGKVFDKEDFVRDEIKKLDDSVKDINKKASEGGKKALVILANDGALSAYGKGSRFGIIHEELGFPLSDEHIDTAVHGQKISFEYVVEKNPDYIFVVDRGAVVQGGHKSVNKILENDLIKTTKAYKNNKIISLNPELWYISSGGIVSTTEMLKEIKDSIK
ncbi:siderophore ABC transporter substrate-binding protein [Clostridium botulinum]|uniref:Iron chelate uptake ABC transporter, FeCT family, solute-binding protein n=1 Tax=Clostridium botulinum (strain Langeland / NCTC 10281 / Type F) TaxID=441772 RepID=A7GC96_CLOBL|nr:siderophore ABC transporter substrate-binding protein [Clostridium botulinum]ABS39788.1 iron chelate uptake ABC transporter, FeCT family, solute-binding protein [Clostridium botulinum F str. Langeland]ADF98870.1 iron chelate uptake ABC transporter, FeCT family, solute-binding protein [Clostridium botulinum F str. 230613]KKM39854.1 ABC transporter [Clostridium botulinum]MBY6792133.1 siderophore ABC transporter substrate-binding protein [Clostridium botulinum]MBY6936142.1 siderophore ABC tran